MDVEEIVAAVRAGIFSTRDLVRISCALAGRGKNTTSVLGQYGEQLVATAYGGKTGNFSQKGYDVITADGEKLQVKTFTTGRRPGVIRSFVYNVVTVEIDPDTASVVSARLYRAADLWEVFYTTYQVKYHDKPFGGRDIQREDRFDRGWSIGSGVEPTEVTDKFLGIEVLSIWLLCCPACRSCSIAHQLVRQVGLPETVEALGRFEDFFLLAWDRLREGLRE